MRRSVVFAALAPILLSRSVESSTASTDGSPMLHFRQNFFSQEAPPVLFGTADLSGLYPFATAQPAHRNGFLQRVVHGTGKSEVTRCRADIDGLQAPAFFPSTTPCAATIAATSLWEADIPMQFDAGHLAAEGVIEAGRRRSVVFARMHAMAADVSN
jgi:hypothetical protein